MARRYYSSTAVATTLSASANNSTTSITVTALSGFPVSTPWTAIIDADTASEEVVEVTNVSGTTLTVTRGVDGTSAVSHSAGAVFRHGVSARDFDEPNEFINTSSRVTFADTQPSSPADGEIWIDSDSTAATLNPNDYVANALFDAKGDLIVASADNTPDNLAVGTDGQVLTADSNESLGVKWADASGGYEANRNLIINGAMQVAQRGTSVTGITSGAYYTADRWIIEPNNLGTWTNSIENDAPTGSGFRKSLKVLCTTANNSPSATSAFYITQRLEGQDLQRVSKGTADAQQLTLTFWVKSNVTGTYVVNLYDDDNTRHVAASYSVSASATWEKKTITFPADTTGAFDNDNASSLRLWFWIGGGSNFTSGTLATTWASYTAANVYVGGTNLAAATNNYWQITGVQLETGPVATPFEFEPFEATLRKCQRYFQKSVRTWPIVTLSAYATNAAWGALYFKQTMRAAPTVTLGATGSSAGQIAATNSGGGWPATIGVNAAEEITEDGFTFKCSGYTSAFTAGNAVIVAANGTATVYTASAEL